MAPRFDIYVRKLELSKPQFPILPSVTFGELSAASSAHRLEFCEHLQAHIT
jgi:hypothetical protein